MFNSIYSLSDGISLNSGELEAEGAGLPWVGKTETPSSMAKTFWPVKSHTKQDDVYAAFTYGFHSFTDYEGTSVNMGAEADGYFPYGMVGE